MKEEVLIGLDAGTTGVRAAAYTQSGNRIFYAEEFYPLLTPKIGYAEQDPDLIYQKIKIVIKKVAFALASMKKIPLGLCLSVAMHSFMLRDRNGKFLGNMWTWADSRSSFQVNKFRQNIKDSLNAAYYQKTCCPPHSCYPYFKMLYMREIFGDLDFLRVYSLKDFVFENLTSLWYIDKSCAGASGFFNVNQLSWDEEILDSVKLRSENFPHIVDTTFVGYLREELSLELCLPKNFPIVIGASDGVLVNLGVGAFKEGEVSMTIGTSAAVRIVSKGIRLDPRARTWCYNLLEDVWVAGGALNNGGIILQWVRDNIYNQASHCNEGLDAYDFMTLSASKIKAGSDGLLVLPFLTGQRAPYYNSDFRGVFFGLSLSHTNSHIIRATLEGICFGLRAVYNILKSLETPKNIRISGSFTKSSLWIQILSDILNQNLMLPKNIEGSAYGAAILGFIALGVVEGLGELKEDSGYRIYHNNPTHASIYEELFRLYEFLCQNLSSSFHDITLLQQRMRKE